MSEYMYPGYIKTDDIVKYCDEKARDYELINPIYSDACSDIGNKCLDLSNRDITEVKHGHYKGVYNGHADGNPVCDIWYCSECNCCFEDWNEKPTYNFCPNCGADMRERKETSE